ncbi:hypothetical protein CFOL_v3_13235 [Cephalotus follicularis]|uniref:Uncharacterized protein n=1 Tax=Cephalotus follicularis TaxID=3775 RepID=A0A1Q3BPE2_CEPFO|nr:hypothetical protein CFOL_v3_13235 [Cephalotus follicularis]
MSTDDLVKLFIARRFHKVLKRKPMSLIKKCWVF